MSQRAREMVVGLVFFATIATLLVFTVLIGDYNPLKPPKQFWVYFEDVAGLREGNVVRVNGLEVGKVKRMKLHPRGVFTLLQVGPSVTVHPGFRVRVRTFSPLGGKYVDLERGRLSEAPMSLPETLPEDEAKQTEAAFKGFTEAEFISEIADLAEKVKPLVISAVANIRDVTDKVNSMQGTLGRLVGDPSMYIHLRNAAKNLEETTASVNRVLGKIDEGDGTLAKLVNDGRLYESTVRTLDSVGNVAARVDRGDGTIGALFTDNRMRDSVVQSAESIASLLGRIDRGEGSAGQFIRNDRFYKAFSQALEDLSRVSGQIAEAKGPLGVLINDERAGDDVRRTIAHLEKVTGAVADGRGTVGRLFMDDTLVTEAERVVVEMRESIEDFREQAPINSFVQAVFQAF